MRPITDHRPSRIAIFLLVLASFTSPAAAAAARGAGGDSARKPNIVLILADDLGYGDLGCYGQKHIRTPNLDRMAAGGVRFTQFYAGSTVCTPSRVVLMTGLHTGHCSLRGNSGRNLPAADVTVGEVLKRAGYATAIIGKWGIGHEGTDAVPTRQGFDSFYGYLHNLHAHNYYPSFLMRDEAREPLKNVVPNEGQHGEGVAGDKLQYSNDVLAEEAMAFLGRQKQAGDGPFFLYLPFTIPHANNEAGERGMEVPDLGEYAQHDDWPAGRKGHAAMVSRLDGYVGRILDRLKELGLEENTLVLFSSDNGPHQEGGFDPDESDSNGPLRGIKRDLYDGGVRVPMIVRWLGRVPPGRTSGHVGSFTDFLVTAAELAGVEPPATDGLSFVPTLLGEDARQERHEYLYWEFYEHGTAQAVRLCDWKAVRKPMVKGKVELYDLRTDLGETRDVADEHPDVVARVERIMGEAHTPSKWWKAPGESE